MADEESKARSTPDGPTRKTAGMIESISEIRAALARETDRVFEIEKVRATPTFDRLVKTQSVGLWNELISNRESLSLPIVGLMCIEQERPALAFDAAVRCVMLSPNPANDLMGYAVTILQKGTEDPKSIARIAQMIEAKTGSNDSIVVLLAAMSRENKLECFKAIDVEQCGASSLAWIVSEVAEHTDGFDEKTNSKFRTCLESLAMTPGISRCVYLSRVGEGAKNIPLCLRLAIIDPDLDQRWLIPPIRRFGKEHRTEIESALRDAPEKRSEFVRKILERLK